MYIQKCLTWCWCFDAPFDGILISLYSLFPSLSLSLSALLETSKRIFEFWRQRVWRVFFCLFLRFFFVVLSLLALVYSTSAIRKQHIEIESERENDNYYGWCCRGLKWLQHQIKSYGSNVWTRKFERGAETWSYHLERTTITIGCT